jgi:glutamine synthetase
MKIIAEYIWLDIKNKYRSKTKIFDIISRTNEETSKYLELSTYPIWNYDGSSTGDIPENDEGNTECLLYPIALYDDPFNNSTDKVKYMLVLCNNSYVLNNKENGVNYIMYNKLNEISSKLDEEVYLFGFEQEFFIIDKKTGLPVGINYLDDIKQGDYYCGNGCYNITTRSFIKDSQIKLLNAGISLTGFNYEVAPGQAEFQLCDYGIKALFQLLIMRFILIRNGENYNLNISFDNILSKKNNINNSGCHVNISNKYMRNNNGLEFIKNKIIILKEKFLKENINEETFNYIFGKDNTERLTGNLETSKWNKFTWGYGTRHTSIRIPNQVIKDNKGYFEDRRPGANVDPFIYIWYLLE